MDCSGCFAELIQLALHGNFECQNHALTILEEQSMRVTPELLREAEEMVKVFTLQPTRPVKMRNCCELICWRSFLGSATGIWRGRPRPNEPLHTPGGAFVLRAEGAVTAFVFQISSHLRT